MSQPLRIALDAMGGDHAPDIVIAGADMALIHHPDSEFLFFGDQVKLKALVAQYPNVAKQSKIIHSEIAISMDEKPSKALRSGGRKSSMWMAIDAVKKGEADVAISAGNTGALMAMAMFCLKRTSGVTRPAIAALWPTLRREAVVLDVGANVGADATQLIDFAVMGSAMARALFGMKSPKVALLNVGVEEIKGIGEIKKADAMLKEMRMPFNYQGFIEGDGIGRGEYDVIVTEGFTGNIALKTAEGTARQIGSYLRDAMKRTLFTKVGAWLAQGGFKALRRKMDPRGMNGGVFLGLNGLVIKSHGGTDAKGFASAIDLGYDMQKNNLTELIIRDTDQFHASLEQQEQQKALLQ